MKRQSRGFGHPSPSIRRRSCWDVWPYIHHPLGVYSQALLGFQGYVFRLLPVYGRLYISSNYFTFRSSGPLTSRTTMILPIRDVLSTQLTKAFRFGHHGLVVIVRGHEELFFEFPDELRRAAFVRLLEKQIEDVRHRVVSGEVPRPTAGERDALILEEFGPRTSVLTEGELISEPDTMDSSLPAVMFTSTSSTFLTFKPKMPLHFTFLTIGSRGDVQPYIALAKGLMADGHRTRIATHGEFKEWIESVSLSRSFICKQYTDLAASMASSSVTLEVIQQS